MAERANKDKPWVFVYGTLKHGWNNWKYYLENRGAKFIGYDHLEGSYRLIDLGYFPAVVRDDTLPKDGNIFGEVYEITDDILNGLDVLEGNGTYYTRQNVYTANDRRVWCYMLPPAYFREQPKRAIEEGTWNPSEEEAKYIKSVMGG